MKIYQYPNESKWKEISMRPVIKQSQLDDLMKDIFCRIEKEGDAALKTYTMMFDGIALSRFAIDEQTFYNAESQLSDELKNSIQIAANNIHAFHVKQKCEPYSIETSEGVRCWRKQIPIEKVGLYIPGGSAPLFSSVLMLAIPARIANCKHIILVTPPDSNGNIHPAILYAAKIAGLKSEQIFKIGGAQAIAAMTIGTESIPKVNKLFGPGNQYVTAAKQYATNYGVAYDIPAGPSEVLVIADETSHASFVAADLLSQAEHGADSQVVLVTTSSEIVESVQKEIVIQLEALPRKDIAKQALENSHILLLENINQCMKFSNLYAPEHLIIATDNADSLIDEIISAGSVFIGHYTPESSGDYASGTNHTLPTNGFARSYSGVSLDSFTKQITMQQITKTGLQTLGPIIEIMAEAEELLAHKMAVTIRLEQLQKTS
jgi:histidinol dehydrogenase